jgi:hypothetical protein
MNAPKTITCGLLFTVALLAPGSVAHHRPAALMPARCGQAAALDPAVMSQIARAQAAVALSRSAGTASLLPFGF